MKPLAKTTYTVHPIIKNRWSPRSFENRMVEEEKLMSVLEAARLAPSAFNEQPWRFVVGQKDTRPELFEEMSSWLMPGNQPWASNASVLILTIAKKDFTANGKANKHALYDVGLAIGNLAAQATDLDLSLHQMAGFSAEKASRALALPENYEPVTMIALGYRATADLLDEPLKSREEAPQVRKPLNEILFTDKEFG